MTRGPLYRLKQFGRAFRAKPSDNALRWARSKLTAEHWDLFVTMSPRDQWHSIQTLRLLRGSRRNDPDVVQAALLHDVGKGRIFMRDRVSYVLLSRVPWLLKRLSSENGPGWRNALHRSRRHPDIGARLAHEAGASPRAVQLIRRHHRPPRGDEAALALAAADDQA